MVRRRSSRENSSEDGMRLENNEHAETRCRRCKEVGLGEKKSGGIDENAARDEINIKKKEVKKKNKGRKRSGW